jgi:hypothetical protein
MFFGCEPHVPTPPTCITRTITNINRITIPGSGCDHGYIDTEVEFKDGIKVMFKGTGDIFKKNSINTICYKKSWGGRLYIDSIEN